MAGIMVRLRLRLRLCSAPVCLSVLFRLWAGEGTTTPVELAGGSFTLLSAGIPDRRFHGVDDAPHHGKPLLVAGTTWTTRLPANAALEDLAPPPTGKRGRPALKGARLGKPVMLVADAIWQTVTVHRCGRTDEDGAWQTSGLARSRVS